MPRANASGTQSCTRLRASRHRSSDRKPLGRCAWFSARASASSWLTRRVAARSTWRCCAASGGFPAALVWRSASSDCMRMPASGVFIWCAASAMKRFCIWMVQRQPLQHVVERADQRRDLFRHLARIDRRKVVGLRARMRCLQLGQRRQAARQREPDQQQGDRQDDELRQDHALDDLVGQLRALVQRLGHLHQRSVALGRRARRTRPCVGDCGSRCPGIMS